MSNFNSPSENKSIFRPQSKRLMDQVREVLRYHHQRKRGQVLQSRISAFLMARLTVE